MRGSTVTRRTALAGAAAAAAIPRRARAATKVRFLSNWFAEAEHGGFYQAQATGLYEKAGLDVDVKMGGPQVNGMQLMLGGEADLIMGYDIQVLSAVEKNLPVTTIAACFQFDLAGIMAHPGVASLASLKGSKILISNASFVTFWPWLRQKFGFTDDMTGPYTFNLQPFFADPKLSVQGYVTAEPFEAKKHGIDPKFFLFADDGYPPYSTTIVTTRGYIEKNSDTVARFVKATMEGWKSYMADPAPGNALIKKANPKMGDDQIAYSVNALRQIKAVNAGDAATAGIGIMTEARWEKTRDFLVAGNLLKADTDWKKAFTTEYVKDLKIMM
jgi:NitT/TauT family transport system substrate-binding protein